MLNTAQTAMEDRPDGPAEDRDWWRQAAVYQIYPRSFADSNGDGIGDLAGITSRIPYLASLGVDAVWLSPFYPSALADGGYDVDNYRDVDPKLGTLADFDVMIGALHDSGIKLVVDIVPNHSSNQHRWFKEALAAPKGSPERDRYIFRDGIGPDGAQPPSDWESMFGGSAWEPVGDGQFYLHLFAREQPDFNWENQEVRADFLATLRFWSDRGVDGFRVDVAHGLAKDLTADPLPAWASVDSTVMDGSHPFWDRDEVHSIYAEWRKVLNEYDPPRTAVAEAWVEPSRRVRYASQDNLGQAFNFDLLSADFDAGQFRAVISENLALSGESGSSSTWVLSNHDVVRHPTRYGLPPKDAGGTVWPGRAWLLTGGLRPVLKRDLGLRRARAATLLMLALPGSAYLYQGEELGLHEIADIPDEMRQDPTFFRNRNVDVGRDGCRIPLPWSADGPSFGFGRGAAHLPQPAGFARLSVDAQKGDRSSTLWMYKDALRLRSRLRTSETLRWVDSGNPDVLHFQRDGGWESVTNFRDQPIALPDGEILISSSVVTDGKLPANCTAWLLRGEPKTPGKHVREG